MNEQTVYVFSSKRLGTGPEELGDILIRGMMKTLAKTAPVPTVLIFINTSVELLPLPEVRESLLLLQEQGTKILVCGTCMDYFQLRDHIPAEWGSNMSEIVHTITSASKVVNF